MGDAPHPPRAMWTDRSTHNQPASKAEAAFLVCLLVIAGIVAAPISVVVWTYRLARGRL